MQKIAECLMALQKVAGIAKKEIPLHEPNFSGNEWEYVKSCIDSGWVSSVGEYVNRFENMLVDFTGLPYAVAVVNGTAALHISLLLNGVQAQDEVLLPSLTFVATANAVAYCGAIPHFIDSSEVQLGIDIQKLAVYLAEIAVVRQDVCFNKITGRRLQAIIAVHIYGHSIDMEALHDLAARYKLRVIEDASESLGSYYKGKHTGYFSESTVLSFNGNKIITTGGGGAILFKNLDLAKRAKHLTTTAKIPHGWEFYHDEMGYNYRLPNLNAALGCAQLEQLPSFIKKKRQLAQFYMNAYRAVSGVTILKEPAENQSNYWLNALILSEPNRNFIEQFVAAAAQHKYNLRGLWTPMDKLPMFKNCPKMDLSITEKLFNSVIALPSGTLVGEQHG